MATINITKSGTLNPAAGRFDYDDATFVAYNAGDTFNIYNKATFRINTSTTSRPPGTIQANSSSYGVIDIRNTSTTTPIVVSLNNQTYDILCVYKSQINIQGDWIVVANGDGTASQTIDFSNIGGVSIDLPPCVWVETGDPVDKQLTVGGVAGYFRPFFNCYETTDPLNINILTDYYGDYNHGNVFQFNKTTKIATFGKGGAVGSSLGGAVIPNGARVIYPNIHFTSGVLDTTVANRNEIRFGSAGNANMDVCAFSLNWTFGRGASNGTYGAGDASITNVAVAGICQFSASVGSLLVDNFAAGLDYTSINNASITSANFALTGCTGPVSIDHIYSTSKYSTNGYSHYVMNLRTVTKLGNIFGWHINTSSTTGRYAMQIGNVVNQNEVPLTVGYLHCVGGSLSLSAPNSNLHFTSVGYSARVTGVDDAVVAENGIVITGLSNSTIASLFKLNNGAANRGTLLSADMSSYQYAVKNVTFDGNNNTSSPITMGGKRAYAANWSVNNLRSNPIGDNRAVISDARLSKVVSNSTSLTATIQQGTFHEWVSGSTASYVGSNGGNDASPFNCAYSNAAMTAGRLYIGPFETNVYTHSMNVVSGVEGVDFYLNESNGIFIEGNGVEIIWSSPFVIRGITDFSGATWTPTGTSYKTNATYEIRMAAPSTDGLVYGSWYDATVASNWETARAAINGYSSNTGFWLQLRIKTQAALAGRIFNYANITCTPYSAWTPAEVGFVPITVNGCINGSTAAIFDNTNPSSPVLIKSVTIDSTGSYVFDFPYNFDANPKAYKIFVRKSGYGEVVATGNTYQSGTTVPINQSEYVTVDDSVVSLYTGISINGSTNTITLTENHTIQEVYGYAQYWSTLGSNANYQVPIVTTDAVSFVSSYNLVIDGCALSGVGSENIGTNNLTFLNGGTSSINITYGLGTHTNITLSNLVLGSRVQIYDVTGATELFNGIVNSTDYSLAYLWTTNKTIRLRAQYVSGTTAKKWYEVTGTVTVSGLNFNVAQVDDNVYNANNIDGSTVTECSISGSTLLVDINDPDNSTTWGRIYAFEVYWLGTSTGIADQNLYIDAIDVAHYIYEGGMKIKNIKTNPLVVSGGFAVDSNGITANVFDTTGGNIYAGDPNVVGIDQATQQALLRKELRISKYS